MDVLVLTVVHDPEDTRIRHKQIAALRDAGHAVTLAAPFSGYARPLPSDFRSIDVPRAHGLNRLGALRAARNLLRRRAADYDVVLMHDPELLLAASGLDHPGLVWDVHEDTAAAIGMKPWLPRPARPLATGLIRYLERRAERRTTLLLAEEGYARRFRGDHPVIRNSAAEPEELDVPVDNRVVYLGRITLPRGAREMLELGRRLAPEIEVHLIGNADDDCADHVREAHDAGHVHWHGFVPNDQALGRLPGALAGLSLLHDQPNYAHSRPTKILEYMAYGLPVVTTPNPASTELVSGHDCGVVVPFGDVDAVEAAVLRLSSDRAERDRLAAAGRKAVTEHYSWEADAGLFVETLERAAARR
ncbi:glycosyltransferase [Phytoactinopolyspora halotolerans]|uniref:Glycosyltransferase family 4 protein n=1 Tax=Phytoactinopolyspora halotolerans TaxID=1981512 RepID=A0A6L9SFD1_9ACTN|nr:glycosyltransferase [Phytoactinopolyspora halotolerans]NEE04085.1 glycosyltransferase family 4 protein [Phytoactinopolyspora halotolerans]